MNLPAYELSRKPTVFVGVDVGLDGAVAAIIEGTPGLALYEMPTDTSITGTKKKPTKRRYVNGQKLRAIFRTLQEQAGEIFVMIERPQLRPALRRDPLTQELKVNQGVASQAAFMEQYGLIRGILIGLGIPHEDIHAATWHADVFHGRSDKTDARVLAASIFPAAAQRFARVNDDGLADAALLADYLRRRHGAPF